MRSSLRIGINGFEAVVPRLGYNSRSLPNRVGSSEFCFELLVELEKIDSDNEYIIYLPVEPTADMPKARRGWQYKVIPNIKLWTIFGLTRELLKRPKLDVFFSPTHYGPLCSPFPEVISVLDLSYKYFPELFKRKDLLQLSLWGGYSMKKASRILTISKSSKNDIIKEYPVSQDKISVVYLGVKEIGTSKMTKKDLSSKYKINFPYILFVGTLQPRKNIVRLIEAFAKVILERSDRIPLGSRDPIGHFAPSRMTLVIVGKKGWMYEDILAAPDKFGVSDSVLFLENVTDEELPVFYENAEVFVMPSLYEGFGLPILEAMKYGCPVVASNVSSLPEAGGSAAIYFNPEDVNDIAGKIKQVIEDDNLRKEMIKKGFDQVKKFSWEKAARETLKVLEEVVKRHS